MQFQIHRHSVCLADDMTDHMVLYDVCPSSKFSGLFRNLIAREYFPQVAGGDVVWVLCCGGEELIAWKTADNTFFSRLPAPEPVILSNPGWVCAASITFAYYSPPEKRACQLFLECQSRPEELRRAGVWEEYQSYHIPPSREALWREA